MKLIIFIHTLICKSFILKLIIILIFSVKIVVLVYFIFKQNTPNVQLQIFNLKNIENPAIQSIPSFLQATTIIMYCHECRQLYRLCSCVRKASCQLSWIYKSGNQNLKLNNMIWCSDQERYQNNQNTLSPCVSHARSIGQQKLYIYFQVIHVQLYLYPITFFFGWLAKTLNPMEHGTPYQERWRLFVLDKYQWWLENTLKTGLTELSLTIPNENRSFFFFFIPREVVVPIN